jgi:hypothetical protein
MWPSGAALFISGWQACAPDEIDIPPVPEHLADHKVAKLVQKYRATGKSKYLDRAGQTLVPRTKLWFLAITK